MANIIPIVAVWQHRFTFFQVVYLYWFETVLLIIPNWIRIGMAQGDQMETGLKSFVKDAKPRILGIDPPRVYTRGQKAGIMFRYAFGKMAIMMFYLIFIIVFLGLLMGNKDEMIKVFTTILLRDAVFNAAVLVFVISMAVQLLAGYVMNGKYKIMSPLNYNNIFDGRTIVMHIVIVLSGVGYANLFKGKPIESWGPLAFTMLFVFLKTLLDLFSLNKEDYKMQNEGVPYI